MKVSNYNFFIKRGTGIKDYIAYNSRTNALALVSEEQFEAVKNFENTGKMIENTDFLEELKIGGFVINTEINELEQIKFKMLRQRFRTDVLSLIIAPTSDCNFRCIYCYEKDSIKHPPMSLEVQDSIVDFVKQKSKTIKRLRVTWYGGEPMLCFEIIKKLSFEMIEICRENNIDYAAGIVTNGYFLTPENCKEFIDLKIMSMQITLDGDKEYHDSRRILKDGRGSFDKIIHNLQTIKGILPYKISIRINVDRENEKAIAHFLELLKKEEIDNVVIPYLAMVKSINNCYSGDLCYSSKEFASIYYDFELKKNSDRKLKGYPTLKYNFCCADMINAFVIDSDGNIYKCWDDIGIYERSVGSLMDKEKKKSLALMQYMMYDPTQDSECKECKILPICMGGCHSCRIQGNDRCDYLKDYLEVYLTRIVGQIKNIN